jgi:hypothetical protein
MTKGGNFFKDFFRNFTDDLLRIWSRMVAQMSMKWILSGLSSLFPALGGGAASANPSVGGGQYMGPGEFYVATGLIPAAAGGVFTGGFRPVAAFATGGIVRRPTLGLVGEGGQNEAVVPLPDGKTIPVSMKGKDASGPQNITVKNEFTILAMDTVSMDQALLARRTMFEGMVHDALARGGVLRDAVKRYGQ